MGNIWVNYIVNTIVVCQNPNCRRIATRYPSDIKKSKLTFCSTSCSTAYYNAIRQSLIVLRKCKRIGCTNYIHSSNPNINYCGGKCSRLFRLGLTSYTAESVITIIQTFVFENGRIPIKNELGYLNRIARRFFGTWNNMIKSAGYDPNPVMFSKHYLANDGHKCDSMAEKIVDDWLYIREIEHRVHVPYPWNNGMKCDFLIDNTWVEIFGLEGNVARYDELKREKLDLIKTHKLKLFRLTLKDVYSKKRLRIKMSIF